MADGARHCLLVGRVVFDSFRDTSARRYCQGNAKKPAICGGYRNRRVSYVYRVEECRFRRCRSEYIRQIRRAWLSLAYYARGRRPDDISTQTQKLVCVSRGHCVRYDRGHCLWLGFAADADPGCTGFSEHDVQARHFRCVKTKPAADDHRDNVYRPLRFVIFVIDVYGRVACGRTTR